MPTWKAGGYVIRLYENDHRPVHVHVFKDGRLVARYDLENDCRMDGEDGSGEKHLGRIRRALVQAKLSRKRKMAATTRRPRTTPGPRRSATSLRGKASSELPGDASGLALVISAIGNLVQAGSNERLKQEKEHLVATLRDWRTAYERLQAHASKLREAFRTTAEQLEVAERERDEWRTRCLKAESELRDSRAAAGGSVSADSTRPR